jgi:hypothetical protein
MRPISKRYAAIVETPLDERIRQAMRLPEGATHRDAIALSLVRAAIKGKIDAAREVREAIEEKAKQRVELAVPDVDPLAEQIRNLTDEELDRVISQGLVRCGLVPEKVSEP